MQIKCQTHKFLEEIFNFTTIFDNYLVRYIVEPLYNTALSLALVFEMQSVQVFIQINICTPPRCNIYLKNFLAVTFIRRIYKPYRGTCLSCLLEVVLNYG